MDINFKAWKSSDSPKRILAIRIQAMGDTVITLPYLQTLRDSLPADVKLDFLTRADFASIPESLNLFDRVYRLKGNRHTKKRFAYACLLLPQLMLNRYDVVIDLQNNIISKMIRRWIRPKAWSEFDRFSPIAAGERTRSTIESAGLGRNFMATHLTLKHQSDIDKLLKTAGWDGKSKLVILNPAGAFITRNWPIESYAGFAKQWLVKYPDTQFVMIGIPFIAAKAADLKAALGNKLINLVEKTTQTQAFAILQKAQFILSEDSGLMHMAWIANVPTVVMFGSTRSDWARPLNTRSLLFSSDDLPCGNCMQEACQHGDNRCLTRHTPDMMVSRITNFLKQHQLIA